MATILHPPANDLGPHKGVLRVSYQLLVELLQLPEGARIERIVESTLEVDILQFVVAHPDLSEVGEGQIIPIVNPTFQTEQCDGPHGVTSFVEWGEPSWPPATPCVAWEDYDDEG